MGKKSKKVQIPNNSIVNLLNVQQPLSSQANIKGKYLHCMKYKKQSQQNQQSTRYKTQTQDDNQINSSQIQLCAPIKLTIQNNNFRVTNLQILQFISNIEGYSQLYGQLVVDENFTILYADSYAKQLFEDSLSPFQTNNLLDLILKEDREQFIDNCQNCLKEKFWFSYFIYSKISARKYGNYPLPRSPLKIDYIFRYLKPLQSQLIPAIINFAGYQIYKDSFWNKNYLGTGLITKCYVLRTHQIDLIKQNLDGYDFQNDQFIKKINKNLRKKKNFENMVKIDVSIQQLHEVLNQDSISEDEDSFLKGYIEAIETESGQLDQSRLQQPQVKQFIFECLQKTDKKTYRNPRCLKLIQNIQINKNKNKNSQNWNKLPIKRRRKIHCNSYKENQNELNIQNLPQKQQFINKQKLSELNNNLPKQEIQQKEEEKINKIQRIRQKAKTKGKLLLNQSQIENKKSKKINKKTLPSKKQQKGEKILKQCNNNYINNQISHGKRTNQKKIRKNINILPVKQQIIPSLSQNRPQNDYKQPAQQDIKNFLTQEAPRFNEKFFQLQLQYQQPSFIIQQSNQMNDIISQKAAVHTSQHNYAQQKNFTFSKKIDIYLQGFIN